MKGDGKPKPKLVNLLGKSVKRTPAKTKTDVSMVPQVSDVRKIEYECPQCANRFSVYFSAYRHIQKFHCVDSKGNSVASKTLAKVTAAPLQAPNSPDIIKPVRIETCIKCNMRVRATELHSCLNTISSNMINPLSTPCVCMGCHQKFPSILLFDMHVQGLHSKGVETLFFPNIHTFHEWKDQMESQTKIKYLILAKFNFKQTYRCTHVPETTDEVEEQQLCPSSVIVKEFSKSIQVHFYKEHHGHSCNYKLPDRFKKFLYSEVMKKPYDVTTSEEDLYAKFKYIVDSAVELAYNADTETLKLVYDKALEMEKILKADEEVKPATKNMTDKQITQTLENLGEKVQERRKSERRESILEKAKDPVQPKAKVQAALEVTKSQVATDVSKSEEAVEEEVTKDTLAGKRANAIKTVDVPVKRTRKIEEVKESDTAITNDKSPTCFNDSYKEFVDKMNEKKIALKTVDKPINKIKPHSKKKIKTKIGQFKPNVSPKKPERGKQEVVLPENNDESDDNYQDNDSDGLYSTSYISELSKSTIDLDYEVIEQEDDCNILVLKI